MNELTDRELINVRRRFLDTIKSFFVEEPDAERMSRWRGFFTALAKERVNPRMDTAVKEIDRLLAEMKLDEIKDEYYELFVNPFGEHLAHTTLSYFSDGHDFGLSLVNFRSFLKQSKLIKKDDVDDSEDSLVFMLDVLATLIEDEKENLDDSRSRQSQLLREFLDPLTGHFSQAMKQNEKARFYEACSLFLAGYVDLEKGLIAPT